MKVIICGAGFIGRSVAVYLDSIGHSVTIIDKSKAALDLAKSIAPIYCVLGDALSIELLENNDASKVDIVLAVTNSDAVNLAICQIAKSFFTVKINVARIKRDAWFYGNRIADDFAPDFVFSPELVIANALFCKLKWPMISKKFTAQCGLKICLCNAKIGKKFLLNFNAISKKFNGVILGILHDNIILMPDDCLNIKMDTDDRLIIVVKDLSFLNGNLFTDFVQFSSGFVLFVGKIEILHTLLKIMQKNEVKRKILFISNNENKAFTAANEFEKVDVIKGNVFDQLTIETIAKYGIKNAILATGDDARNVMLSLYLKRCLSTELSTFIINSEFTNDFLNHLNVDYNIDLCREANHFFSYIISNAFHVGHKSYVLSDIKIIEMKIDLSSDFVGKSVKEFLLKYKIDSALALLRSDSIFLPNYDSKLELGDVVLGVNRAS
ncbi:Trk system potassium uptake protein TrkA (modular protein) [Candidatus Xenohaliotis californiensis]|uniref:Trk system potassium uptake protein TrkA n=1 Tax=Candidatus Xenohaliotis californiensis TaxID=84677 RepID=A0ABP0ESK3_9RICK|nr:Trk system potassium uptake protein TrkA (modular protein) [Candidatus Xenohaliotis californiensis]